MIDPAEAADTIAIVDQYFHELDGHFITKAVEFLAGLARAGSAVQRMAQERGSALITAVIMLMVLALFSFGFERMKRNEPIVAGSAVRTAVAEVLRYFGGTSPRCTA